MTNGGVTDRGQLGFFALQDHDPNVPIGSRQCLAGLRISKLLDPSEASTADGMVLEYAREEEMGTIGDIHPWLYWQTKDRDKRDCGSWSMVFASLVTQGLENPRELVAKVHPMRGRQGGAGPLTGPDAAAQEARRLEPRSDPRYLIKTPIWPASLGALPRGTVTMLIPGTEETKQEDLLMRTDPRLIAPSTSGPGEAGTLIADLQPTGEICMAGAAPGFGGRHARLQALVRVITMPGADATTSPSGPFTPGDTVGGSSGGAGLGKLDAVGNMLALNYSKAASDGVAGYGAVFGRLAGGGATGGAEPSKPPEDEDEGKAPGEFGTLSPRAVPGHGIGLMATLGGGGPIIVGAGKQDQHYIGDDFDGHPIGSAHIWAGALFWKDRAKDGPLFFEGNYPGDLDKLPGEAMVHLTWDGGKKHNWAGFGERPGLWKWYADVPYVTPTTGGPKTGVPPPTVVQPPAPTGPGGGTFVPPDPKTGGTFIPGDEDDPERGTVIQPGGPTFKGGSGVSPEPPPNPGGGLGTVVNPTSFPGSDPIPAGPPEPGAGRGGIRDLLRDTEDAGRAPSPHPGVSEKVGDSQAEDGVGRFSILHPLHESFGAIGFRPQRWVDGEPNYEHNPLVSRDQVLADEESRPQVAVLRAWGAQTPSGDWDYTERPDASRARGGLALGGVLFGPPNVEMEDYLGLAGGSEADVRATGARAYFTAAPGAALALGTPTSTTGNLMPKSVTFEQDFTQTNETLRICQMSSGSVLTDLIRAELDQSTDKIRVRIEGDGALILPRGNDAARPTGTFAPTGGEIRISSEDAADVVEFWEDQVGAWTAVGSGGGVTDHGALTGLLDNDHTQYALLTGASFTGNVSLIDGQLLRLGTGLDSTITFDGTNTVWDPKAGGGTGFINIQGDLVFDDNDEVFWGTGKDASILYNGTNLVLDSALVGSGKTVFRDILLMQDNVPIYLGNSGDGRLSFNGTDVILDPDAVGSGKFRVTGDIRTDGAYFVGTAQGVTDSISWVNSDGDTVVIETTGGMITTLEVNPP